MMSYKERPEGVAEHGERGFGRDSTGAVANALEQLRAARRRALQLDANACMESPELGGLRARVAEPLGELLGAAIDHMSTLTDADDYDSAAEGGTDDDLGGEWDSLESSTVCQPAIPASGGLGNVAFTARLELLRAMARLKQASTEEELLVACDRARRKLKRCVDAVAREARARTPTEPPPPYLDSLESAILVRSAYAKFREAIPPCDPADPECLARTVRVSVNAVSTLLGGRAYAHIRFADRHMLREIQRRMIEWARAPEPSVGPRLLQDLQTTADLMRDINHRQELVEHDRVALARLGELTARPSLERAELEELRAILRRLRGYCNELDRLEADDRDREDDALVDAVRGVLGCFL